MVASVKESVVNLNNLTKTKMEFSNSKKNTSSLLTSELMALLCVLKASIGLFINGTFVGWSSSAVDFIPETFSTQENMRVFSAVALGAAIGPLIIHKIWHLIGSKRIILIANLLMIISWILSAFSDIYWCLLVGRGLGGLAVGTLHFLIPLYINDIATNEQKPLYNFIVQLQFVLGILTQYVLTLCNSFLLTNCLPAIVSSGMFVTFFFMPESPRFLLLHGDADQAKEILLKFKSIDHDVEQDMQVWASGHHKKGYLNAFKEDFGIKFAIPVFGVFMFDQLIGAVSILFYMRKILTLTEGDYSPEVTAILCCVIFAISISLPNILEFKLNAIKSNLIWSNNLMALSLCILGIYCHYQGSFGHIYTEEYRQLPLICLGLFYYFYATGSYRLTHEYAEQIIPKKCYFTIRCLLTTTCWLFIYSITRALPRLIDVIGVGWMFWFMAIMCIFMAIFVKVFVPDWKKMPEESKLVDSSESFSEA